MHINFVIFRIGDEEKINQRIYLGPIENALFKINWKFSCEAFESKIPESKGKKKRFEIFHIC